ncbi:hypothetical protein B0H17DRAFT_1212458 [Mycena rosella]|uniref:Uncharacterized protein n=1 Tax=Mycena rosella TaxID=1033263 RepID=A0AAD7CSJ6_MYCRO|nr:hypothetical protein B0H17DRAFT_1212458 [Mycena rosella]
MPSTFGSLQPASDEDGDGDQITEPRTSGGCNHTPDETLGAPPSSDGNNERLPTMISALSSQVAALSDLIQRPQREEPRKTDIRLRRIEREIKGMKGQILGVHSGISALLATESRGGQPSSTALPLRAAAAAPDASMVYHRVVPSTSTFVPAEAIEPENLTVVLLENDEEFTFDNGRVPVPPNIHFSSDIPRLFREWESSTLLTVNGRGIAIKYWPLFYQRRKQGRSHKNGAWDKIRTVWGNWKFLVEECQRFPSEEDFWARYSTAGVRLRYQQILDALKEARESQEKSDAAAARRFFHDNLDHPDADGAFAYTKTGQRRIKEKDSAVAEIWRELLANNAEIARRDGDDSEPRFPRFTRI